MAMGKKSGMGKSPKMPGTKSLNGAKKDSMQALQIANRKGWGSSPESKLDKAANAVLGKGYAHKGGTNGSAY